MIRPAGDLLTVGYDETADGLLEVLRRDPMQQGHGTLEALRYEQVVTMRRQRHEHLVLLIIPAEDDLDAGVDPVVAAYGQESYIIGVDGLLVFEEIA